jgi:hypothetical protein
MPSHTGLCTILHGTAFPGETPLAQREGGPSRDETGQVTTDRSRDPSDRPLSISSVSPQARFQVSGFGFWVSGLGFGGMGFGFRVSGFGFWVAGLGFQVLGIAPSDLGCGVWGLGFGVWGPGEVAMVKVGHLWRNNK